MFLDVLDMLTKKVLAICAFMNKSKIPYKVCDMISFLASKMGEQWYMHPYIYFHAGKAWKIIP